MIFATAARRTIATRPARLVLDFAGVTFCDSQGLSALIALNKDVRATGGRLVFINVGEFMGRLLDITGLRAAFEDDPTPPLTTSHRLAQAGIVRVPGQPR